MLQTEGVDGEGIAVYLVDERPGVGDVDMSNTGAAEGMTGGLLLALQSLNADRTEISAHSSMKEILLVIAVIVLVALMDFVLLLKLLVSKPNLPVAWKMIHAMSI